MLISAMHILGKAESVPDWTNLGTMMASVLVFAGAALLVFFPIRLARIRGNRHAEAIMAGAILWACLAVGSVILPMVAKAKFANDHTVMMMQGDVAPDDLSGAPAWPWAIWAALAALYVVLYLMAAWGRKGDVGDETGGAADDSATPRL